MTRRGSLSLRARVLIGLGSIAAVAVAAAIAVTAVTHSHLVVQLDERLDSFAIPLRESDQDPELVDPNDLRREYARPSDAWRAFLLSSGELGGIVAPNTIGSTDASPVLTLDDLPETGDAYFTVPSSDGEGEWRVYARVSALGTDLTALPLDSVESTTQQLIVIEAISIGATLIGLSVVGWWVIRLGISPMRRMVDASARIADGDLDVRLEGVGHGSESAELAQSLNTMIGTLTDALDERERSEARLREFVADASHELRTPLTTVLGYAELYRRGALRQDEDVADAWGRTEAEASRMRRLVEDMLELARFDAEPQLMLVTVDLATLGAEVVGDARAAREGVSFTVDAPVAVPVVGDADKLRQAVINLVTNAAVHGGSAITVRVRVDGDDGVVQVIDDGPGMTPEMAARATERFVRGDGSRARSTGGSGLGLAITSAIVDAHGGTLAVESVEGEGTTVTIRMPLGTYEPPVRTSEIEAAPASD
ncbi:sensor histidine kinase [Demequina lignilytica]|uniref:histidine kinase n=1 Tax=Demequina lignilytica TaxID=3051663 RepID=A0AAW7M9D2_9MICO|nr:MULTISPECIES: HAMP domain-containing sensor histidine kinase [unclassified Demequina]MDN4477957.1 HAMP domain-containing sensor histidine kinase [Demequina sp. SYSU T00039-1]MDN4484264.1 HAMP domain-containing sensor histidine kinase [Demequina sp. SYSU T0a273]MDN4487866.1 HAMP domain-containing sensor histidine kinase [Demequina sp. SYSU T00039]MDN4490751.1 HAMP domain-containing sensor histidine kinase [Demequina sp. SYSU T00068]